MASAETRCSPGKPRARRLPDMVLAMVLAAGAAEAGRRGRGWSCGGRMLQSREGREVGGRRRVAGREGGGAGEGDKREGGRERTGAWLWQGLQASEKEG